MKYVIIMLSIIFITDVGTCLGVEQSICDTGEITYHANGQLKSCTLKDDFATNGIKCKQYASVSFYETGKLENCVASDFFIYGSVICNQYPPLSLALEAGYLIGEHPVSQEVAESVLSKQVDDLEPTLTRNGYSWRDLAEQFGAKQTEIKAMFRNQLEPSRSKELREQMLAAGLPI